MPPTLTAIVAQAFLQRRASLQAMSLPWQAILPERRICTPPLQVGTVSRPDTDLRPCPPAEWRGCTMRMKRYIIAIGAAALGLVACGSTVSTGNVKVHGTLGDVEAAGSLLGCVHAGDQIKITNSAGKVLATPKLGKGFTKYISINGLAMVPVAFYPFSATVPPEPFYGVSVGSAFVRQVSQGEFVSGADIDC